MKKRILGMLLCLVMVMSLLPITAAAFDFYIHEVHIYGRGFEKGTDGVYVLQDDSWKVIGGDKYGSFDFSSDCEGSSIGLYQNERLTLPVTDDPVDGGVYYLQYRITWGEEASVNVDLWGCSLEIPGYSTAYIENSAGNSYIDITFQVTKIHEHDWQFTTTENSLTATCQNSGCTIGEVSVTLTAHSVTLPESPFNAKVEVTGAFKEAFPGAEISDIRYDYEDSEGAWHYDIDPIPANAKAGQYQAGVCVSGLSGNPGAALMALSTDDGINQGGQSVYLFVKYTAADPAVTAQTGDSRPIELMMAGVVAFSVLAVAAFILDSKRKYSR